jgi:hypothetical protein
VAKKTLRNFQVAGALFVSPGGAEIAAGDEVRLFLNQIANPAFPEFVDGIAQNPITRVNLVSGGCVVEGTSYTFEYEADDLDGAATMLNVCDVVEVSAIACCEVLRDALDEEIDARTAADTALQENIDDVQDDLDTWDVLELTAEPVDGVLGAKQITTQTVIGTVLTGGTAITTVTAAGLTGSPLALTFEVDAGDTPSVVAAKAAAKLELTAAVTALFEVDNIASSYALTRKIEAANDATLNLEITNGTCTGLTPDATSTATQAGLAPVIGTVAERIGRRAVFGGRLFEARNTNPNEWVEITTEHNSVNFRAALTALTGTNGLDTLEVTTEDIGRAQLVDVGGLAYVYELTSSTLPEVSPEFIRPNNYADGTNEVVWRLRHAVTRSSAVLDASSGGNGVADDSKVVRYGSFGELVATANISIVQESTGEILTLGTFGPTGSRTVNFPDINGTVAVYPTVVAATPITGFTINAGRYEDQTHYLTPAAGLASGSFVLPTANSSRVGQIVRLWTTQVITSGTVSVSGGGTIRGAAIAASTIAANTPYAWQCVSTAGAGTWIRLQ